MADLQQLTSIFDCGTEGMRRVCSVTRQRFGGIAVSCRLLVAGDRRGQAPSEMLPTGCVRRVTIQGRGGTVRARACLSSGGVAWRGVSAPNPRAVCVVVASLARSLSCNGVSACDGARVARWLPRWSHVQEYMHAASSSSSLTDRHLFCWCPGVLSGGGGPWPGPEAANCARRGVRAKTSDVLRLRSWADHFHFC